MTTQGSLVLDVSLCRFILCFCSLLLIAALPYLYNGIIILLLVVTGRGDNEPKSDAAKQAIADLAAREKMTGAVAGKPAQDASAAATLDTVKSSVPRRHSSRSSRAAAGTMRILNSLGKRVRRGSSSSSIGEGTTTISDGEMEPTSTPKTRSSTAGKRTRIQLLSLVPPDTVQEMTKETEPRKDNQAVEVEAMPAEDVVGTRSPGVLRVRPRNMFQTILVFI